MPKSEKKFNIAWDCDGVLLESHQPVLSQANETLSHITKQDVKIHKSDLTSWNALYDVVLKLTNSEESAKDINQYWFTPEILRRSPPNMAAVEVFRKCQELSDVSQKIITSRTHESRQSTRDSLEAFLPYFNWSKDFHIRTSRCRLSGDNFKAQQLKLHQINFMNEDNQVTIAFIQAKLPECRLNYFSQPWNSQDVDPSRKILRVNPYDPKNIYNRILEAREVFRQNSI